MPRKAIGDRPLTPAERQAHQRAKHKARYADLVETLRAVAEANDLTSAKQLAWFALCRQPTNAR